MKKTIISLAVAAGMAASSAAFADATVYGNAHLSLNDVDTGGPGDDISMDSQTSSIGVKGSDDLGGGMKAFFKIEFQIDPDERARNITDRDQYIGLKGGMGTVKFGTMSSNYKQKGGSVDPMYRTALEGRGSMQTQSSLHGGAGRTAGRMTDTVQYSSPKMGGMQLVINTTFDDAQNTATNDDIDETVGVGFRYEAKAFSVYLDYIDMEMDSLTGPGLSESATKIGGTFKAGPVKLGAQLEQTEDLKGSDYTFVSADYSMDKNNSIYFTYGIRDETAAGNDGSDAFALMFNHNMSKNTNLYVGYGDRSDDVGNGVSITTAGMRVKF